MADLLNVDGKFLITRGMTTTSGPSTWVLVSACSKDGQAFALPEDLPQDTVQVFVALSATFGASYWPLEIVEVRRVESGFVGYRVESAGGGVAVDTLGPSALGIVVYDGTNRGQTLACSCGGAHLTVPD